ncbi:unnamed protein product [Schistosoma margrebowiei]|uniref:Uncharacterized protein n=1 Tax=Schistosoma margrebowiei TaxID=48269 RepID=A0A183M048_9TREM|nr:unnamed protein product [Schistosoma margrebowiei]
MKLKLRRGWITGQTAIQRFNTAFLGDTGKLNKFRLAINNRFQALQGLLEEEKTTMEDNWNAVKEALSSMWQKVLSHQEGTSITK